VAVVAALAACAQAGAPGAASLEAGRGAAGGGAAATTPAGGQAVDGAGHSAAVTIDPALPAYSPRESVTGSLKSIGSDTMLNLMTVWSATFAGYHPSVQVGVEGKGSSTAPPALLENQAQFGPMSRAMSREEVAAFSAKFGYEPTALRAAIDCLAVFVHKDCPIDEISVETLEKLFSVSGPEMTWGDLGVEREGWADRPVSLYGRNSASGTYMFFKQAALNKQDFKASVKEAPGSSGVVAAVAADPYAMGYSGVGYRTPDVKLLNVSFEDGEDGVAPVLEAANDGTYPLARFLYVYVNYDARTGLDGLRAEMVRLIFSRDGQENVIQDGYYPVSAGVAREELEKVGIEAGF
jgi:phosphate transport system substrate-binding protein